jgi:hypothetical protein
MESKRAAVTWVWFSLVMGRPLCLWPWDFWSQAVKVIAAIVIRKKFIMFLWVIFGSFLLVFPGRQSPL